MSSDESLRTLLPGPEGEAVIQLLNKDGDLTPAQREQLQRVAAASMHQVAALTRRMARSAYAVTDPAALAECVGEHLSAQDQAVMITADVYFCPRCHRLLKCRPGVHPVDAA